MKVIFLDIDGVLNHEEWYSKPEVIAMSKQPGFKGTEKEYHFDPDAWKWVKKLLDETGAKLVISSSWRWYDLQATLDDFKGTAFDAMVPYIVGVTPALLSRCRGEEINRFFDDVARDHTKPISGFSEAWFEMWKAHPLQHLSDTGEKIDQYVIIDDSCDMTKAQKKHLVQVDSWVGMQEDDYKKAKHILENGRETH